MRTGGGRLGAEETVIDDATTKGLIAAESPVLSSRPSSLHRLRKSLPPFLMS
jgi:hypothetical protein